MPSLPPIRNFSLKVVFLVHFAFIALSAMGHWNTSGYSFYNSILILLLIWGIYQTQNEEPIQLAIVVNGVSIILDILLLVMCYPDNNSARDKFSAAMCILHLIIRPFSTILLVKNLEERSGSSGALSGILSSGQQQSSYEDIDRSAPPSSQHAGGYDFSTAQQI